MRRRGFLLLGAAVAVPLAAGWAWQEREYAQEAQQQPEVSTDLGPIRRDLVLLGPIVSTHWMQTSPGRPGDRVPGPTDWLSSIVARLAPGQVARLLGDRQTTPVSMPPAQGSAAQVGFADLEIPAPLAPFVPAGGFWVRNEALDTSLVRAESSRLYFDRSSDTVYVSAVNIHDPQAPYAHHDPDGHTVVVTPSPVPVQS
ncbi:hypothetical protein [Kitasatospora paranensis]|uniref:SAF domain-containing protein n=1 Tax=Kitasatospora paranensis TaxID=258053 RepID=A0ABW2G598_9ACTN